MAQPNITLLSYLQLGLPRLTVDRTGQDTRNTTNPNYSEDDIDTVESWDDFNIDKLLEKHRRTLERTGIPYEPMPTSPQPIIRRECGFTSKFAELVIPRVRRGLRNAFVYLSPLGPRDAEITFGVGDIAIILRGFAPDLAYANVAESHRTRANRAPGDLKLSYKWSSFWIGSAIPSHQTQFRQVLSQVNFYMIQNKAKYGLVCTDTEMVAIKRRDGNGNLLMSDSIPWTVSGTHHQPVMTVLLALWWIGMKVSKGKKWKLKSR